MMLKKLIASACALGVCAAFAGEIDSVDFENYAAGMGITTGTGDGVDSGSHWLGDGGEDTAVSNSTDFAAYSGTGKSLGDRVLKLSTSDVLYRSVNAVKGEAGSETLGDAVSVGEGLYIDTLVQFTPSDDPPSVEEDSKLIVWMNATSNLCVTANYIDVTTDAGGEFAGLKVDKTDFVTDKVLVPGTWYRLTVTARNDIMYGDATEGGSGLYVGGFIVKIDGQPVTSATDTISAAALAAENGNWMYPVDRASISAKQMFASLVTGETDTAIAAVGFKGEGALDDYIVTDEDPFGTEPDATDFTLSITLGDNVSSVTYAINGVETTVTENTDNIKVAKEATLVVTGTAAPWYKITSGEIASTTMTADKAVTIEASLAESPAEAGVKGTTAATTAQLKQWATDNSVAFSDLADAAKTTYLNESYLLNTGLLDAAPAMKITKIEEVAGGWNITVAVEGVTLESADGTSAINGTLKVKSAATLGGLGEATAQEYTLTTDGSTTTMTVTVTGTDKFFKATIE